MIYDVIIIGCGPAGLQLSYFLSKLPNKLHFCVLEKSSNVGSFFEKFPHTSSLISINKVHTGYDNQDFNLRHDWNSLLNDEGIAMNMITDEYFPTRQHLVQYLEMFKLKHNLDNFIRFNTNVHRILKSNDVFSVLCNDKKIFKAKKIVVATGLSKYNIPSNIINADTLSKHYAEYPTGWFENKESLQSYKNKRVLIIGNGNSGFEIANALTKYCATIILLGKKQPRPALLSHYVGDVRSKYFDFYDTFLLKSLNALDECTRHLSLRKLPDGKIALYNNYDSKNWYDDVYFDEVINCTGWKFDLDIFDQSTLPVMHNSGKYPIITPRFESANVNNMYFIGSLMHLFDYKKSSGGFIHGFRYLIDNFVKINFTSFQPPLALVPCNSPLVPCNSPLVLCKSIVDHFDKRINQSSALYQMFGQIGDIFWKIGDEYIYHESIPLTYVLSQYNNKIDIPNIIIFILTLEYGRDQVSDLNRVGVNFVQSIGDENKATLLQPILRVYDNSDGDLINNEIFIASPNNFQHLPGLLDVHFFSEDLLANFSLDLNYKTKFNRIIKGYTLASHKTCI